MVGSTRDITQALIILVRIEKHGSVHAEASCDHVGFGAGEPAIAGCSDRPRAGDCVKRISSGSIRTCTCISGGNSRARDGGTIAGRTNPSATNPPLKVSVDGE